MEDQSTQESSSLPSSAEFKRLVDLANGGDRDALDRLRRLLDDNPMVWQRVGDLAAHAELVLIDVIAGNDQLLKESLRRTLDELKAELGAATAGRLERMGIERLATCWLQLQHIDVLVGKATPGSRPARFLLQRQGQANRAYDAALKSLVTMGKLLPMASERNGQQVPPAAPTDGCASPGDRADRLRVFSAAEAGQRRQA